MSTARTDLDNAFSILDAGITAHVHALKTAHAAIADESYLQAVTAKVIALADTLAASNPVVPADVVPAAVIASVAPQPAPAALVLPAAPVAAPAVLAAPAAPQDEPDGHVPSVLETMEAAVKAMMAHK